MVGRKRSGLGAFTLVELLVAISIIAVLMMVMMPALTRVRSQAKTALGKSNLKQIGLFASIYASDNGGKFWSSIDPERSWLDIFSVYSSGDDSYAYCPMAKKGTPEGFGGTENAWGPGLDDLGFDEDESSSYGMNFWLCNASSDHVSNGEVKPKTHFWRQLADCKDDTPMFADCMWWGGYPEDYESGKYGSLIPRSENWMQDYSSLTGRIGGFDIARFCLPRHGNAINVVFADGSVSTVDLENLWNIKWHRQYRKKADVVIPWLHGY